MGVGVEGAAAGVLGGVGLAASLAAGGEVVGAGCVLSCASSRCEAGKRQDEREAGQFRDIRKSRATVSHGAEFYSKCWRPQGPIGNT